MYSVAATAPAVGCPPCGTSRPADARPVVKPRPSDATPRVKLSRRMAALYWNLAVGCLLCKATQRSLGKSVQPCTNQPQVLNIAEGYLVCSRQHLSTLTALLLLQ